MKVSTYVFGYLRSWRRGRGGAEELKCGTMRVSLSCGDGDGADGGCHVSVAESAAISRPFALPFPLSMCLCERRGGEEEGRMRRQRRTLWVAVLPRRSLEWIMVSATCYD